MSIGAAVAGVAAKAGKMKAIKACRNGNTNACGELCSKLPKRVRKSAYPCLAANCYNPNQPQNIQLDACRRACKGKGRGWPSHLPVARAACNKTGPSKMVSMRGNALKQEVQLSGNANKLSKQVPKAILTGNRALSENCCDRLEKQVRKNRGMIQKLMRKRERRMKRFRIPKMKCDRGVTAPSAPTRQLRSTMQNCGFLCKRSKGKDTSACNKAERASIELCHNKDKMFACRRLCRMSKGEDKKSCEKSKKKDGFSNMNLDINNCCMIIFVLILIFLFRKEIMAFLK